MKKKAKRRALQSLEVGAEESGTIVEVSLNDGLRVDIGAEIDVLVPLSIQGREDAPAKVAKNYPLKKKLVVKIEEVSADPARRFPVIASVKKEPLQSLEQAQTALRPHGGASDRSRSEGVELSKLDDWQPAGPLEVREELEELPLRPPPEVVRSLGRNRQLQDVEVPEAMRSPAPDVSDAAREAWTNFAENRAEELRWELRCRERLAADLLVVEADILRGRSPTIPLGLLGLTVMEDGKRYMLPQPDGDSLKFSVQEDEDLQAMVASCRESWAAEAVEPETRQKLALSFACADAWHARMVQAAEAVEIQRLGWGRETGDDDDSLALAVEEMIAKTPELQDQASMEAEYLLNELDENELANLEHWYLTCLRFFSFKEVIPQHSHLEVDFGAIEPTCLAHALLNLIAAVDLPDFDIVLNHGDLPLLRKEHEKPPFYGPMDKEARTPAPLFSICASEDFWDILFPNVCRPALVNMSSMSAIPWEAKTPAAFWRGTDRGAVNWAVELQDMYRGSPRKRFLDTWSENPNFDLAFLEDDLLNATVVNTDPSFVPLDKWPRWRYLLDLPGNGYSGSLKQKLTTTSAVLMMKNVNVVGSQPVYEHYHGGLQDGVHVLVVSMNDAGQKVAWAQQHDDQMKEMVANANRYMEDVQKLTQCYLWFLIKRFASLLRYKPQQEQTSAFSSRASVRTMKVHRRPLRREAAAFKKTCEELLADSEE
ncbi:POGLUT2 [Symbiodinium microadriaticum]|nr:POGLUT2 [Symbiodinium microadriaticum]